MSAARRRPAAAQALATDAADTLLEQWFAEQRWTPQPFQREVWAAYAAGRGGLLHAPTGSGKTLAIWGGPLLEGLAGRGSASRLRHLWITPLRALAEDTAAALRAPAEALQLGWKIGVRTGDSSTSVRKRAREGGFDVLVTTPESVALLLSYPDTAPTLAGLRSIVVDEWHELLGSKRGVLLELCLARLRRLAPAARVWGVSATLGNLPQAREVLHPGRDDAPLVEARLPRPFELVTLLPEQGERFPWAGHLGLRQLPRVLAELQNARSTLLFTNTRSQAELWHRALASVWMDAPETLALHHGSLDPALRRAAEQGLREGSVRCVVATSSLDLGVDFGPVDQVIQIGSPKGVARLLQRAGRSGHRPGERSRVLGVPTNTLELVEFAAARAALAAGHVEPRTPLRLSLDVLAQHLVTLALGGGFVADEVLAEVRGTHAFAQLGDLHWQAVLDFIVRGGSALQHYPEYRRVVVEDGVYRVHDRRQALRHRLSIGTISSDGAVEVRYLKGARLGHLEEAFVGRLRPGDRFRFAGRPLEFVRIREMTAYVRRASGGGGAVPRWMGSRMPLSSELADAMLEQLQLPAHSSPELAAAAPLLALQQRASLLPRPGVLLVEVLRDRQGLLLFVYPFAGRHVHEGLAALTATRWARREPNSFGLAINDYGFVLAAARRTLVDEELLRALFDRGQLADDLEASLNLAEMSRRQFRDIARVAGLLPPSLPGRAPRSLRSLQASSTLLFDVLVQHDPDHVLLGQARREVFEAQLEFRRLDESLARIGGQAIALVPLRWLTPLSFPLWAERMRGNLSSEDWETRVRRAAERLEARYQ